MCNKLIQLPTTAFHGTIDEDDLFQSLTDINYIDLAIGNPRADFGQGFYTTSIFKQALSFARYRANVINRQNKQKVNHPIIIEYEIQVKQLQALNGKIFPAPNTEWAEFIYNNRRNDFDNTPLISDLHNVFSTYHYVYGHVADGKVARLAVQEKTTQFNAGAFLTAIMPKFPKQNDQLSFHSRTALQALKFIRIIKDEHYRFPR